MLILCLAIPAILIVSVLLYTVLESVFFRIKPRGTSEDFDVLWAGLLLQSVLLLLISLFVPVNLWIWLTLAGCLSLIALLSQKVKSRLHATIHHVNQQVGWISILLILIGVVVYGSQAPCNYDTLLYHHQSTQWYAQFGSVRGVALLHYRLGFISSAFAMAAPLESILPHRSATVVNSTALFLALLQITSCIGAITRGHTVRRDVFLCSGLLMVLLMHLLFLDPASAAPDFLVNVATVSIAGSILHLHDEQRTWSFASLVAAVLLPLVKLSAAPVALMVCIDALLRSREERKSVCAVAAIVGLAATAALVGTSWRQTGNLVFPIPALQCDVPWGLDSSTTREVSEEIRSWARWGGPIPDDKTESQWLQVWVRSSKGFLFIAAALGNALALLLMAKQSKGRLLSDRDMVIPGIGLLGALYMLYSAPNPRFGFGMLILGWSWIGQLLVIDLMKRLPLTSSNGIRIDRFRSRETVAVIVSMVFVGFCMWPVDPWRRALNSLTRSPYLAVADGRVNWFIPATIPAIGYDRTAKGGIGAAYAIEFHRDRVNDVDYSYPVNTDCSGSQEIPCANQKIHDIFLADPTRGISAGFTRRSAMGSEQP
ncbi:MAG: hypothetical protein FJ308_15690 [Planctomycetes bacterium]|nr:hypothetical protein [Planctomycetota bacterium]